MCNFHGLTWPSPRTLVDCGLEMFDYLPDDFKEVYYINTELYMNSRCEFTTYCLNFIGVL